MKYLGSILTLVLVWLFLLFVGSGIASLVFDQGRLQNLAEHGTNVWGVVLAKEPDNHNTIRYSFEVNGNIYTGMGSGGRGNPDFGQIQIGQKVIVSYDSNNPENSYLGYPEVAVESQRSLISLFGFAFATLTIVSLGTFVFGLPHLINKNRS